MDFVGGEPPEGEVKIEVDSHTVVLGEVDLEETLVTVLCREGGVSVTKTVYLDGHCLFCLRKTEQGWISKENSGGSLLASVNWTWAVLQGGGGGLGDIFEVPGIWWKLKEVSKFSGFPRICGGCEEKVKGVDKLLRELRREIGALRDVILEGRDCRDVQESLGRSGLSRDKVVDTVEFLEEFRKGIENGVARTELNGCVKNESDPLEMEEDGDPDFQAFINAEKEDDSNDSSYNRSSDEEEDDDDEDYIPRKKLKLIRCSPSRRQRRRTSKQVLPVQVPVQDIPEDVVKQEVDEGDDGGEEFSINHDDDYGTIMKCDPLAINEDDDDSSSLPQRKARKKIDQIHTRRTVNKVKPDLYASITDHWSPDFAQVCDFCKVKLPRKELLEHLKEHVGEEYVIHCPNPDCWFVCVTQHCLWNHTKGYKKQRNKCLERIGMEREKFLKGQRTCSHPNCTFIGRDLKELRGHLIRYHETPEKNWPCPVSGCGMRFSVRQSVVLHLGHHDVPQQVDTQPCLECNAKKKIGIRIEEMEGHLKEVHGAEQVINCQKCPFLFSSWERLVDHIYQHRHGQMTCDICGETGDKFSRHAKLAEHYFKVHQIGKKFQCDLCPKAFLKFVGLQNHVLYEHKNGMAAGSINKPVRQYQYKCEECDMEFKWEDSFRNHNIQFHGGEPYGCKLCTETFSTRQRLRDHENSHKGVVKKKEFPYLCDRCNQRFRSMGGLKTHLKGHQRKAAKYKPRGPMKEGRKRGLKREQKPN